MEDFTGRPREYHTEFEVQAEAYNLLKQSGFLVRGEYAYYDPDFVYYRRGEKRIGRGARFDLVILDCMGDVILIIEVKKTRREYSSSTIRGDKYQKMTGKKCIYIRGMQEAKDVVSIVEKTLDLNDYERATFQNAKG